MQISERGQITIPKHLRERFGMHHKVEVEISPTEDGLLITEADDGEAPGRPRIWDPWQGGAR